MNRREFVLGAGAGACAASSLSAAASPVLRKQPNILLIVTDEQSAGVTSAAMGRRWLHTPHMDSLIQSGTTYDRAYSANPICVPSRAAMFSGRYPTDTGVIDNRGLLVGASSRQTSPPMGKIFKDQGYMTAYFGKWHLNPAPDNEMLHGFRRMSVTVNEDASAIAGAVDFLRRKPQSPFLLVVSVLDPHSICEWARGDHLPLGDLPDPPSPDQCPPAPRNLAPQIGEPDIMTTMRRSYQATSQFPVGNFTPERWRQYLWAYYRLVERADGRVGEVLTALRESGLDEDTIVVFTSDHGDMQGSHGWNQKTVFYEESARVPFVISRKGASARVSRRLVNTGIDLIPTICDYAGIAVPAVLPGLSVRDTKLDPRRYVVASNHLAQGAPMNGREIAPHGRMVRGQRYKYCAYSEGERRESLVDLDSDPGETRNLVDDPRHASMLREHRAMLAEWCGQTKDSFAVPGPPA